MKALVLGASGATGKLAAGQLLKRGIDVRVVVRESAIIPEYMGGNKSVEIVKGNIYDFDIKKIKELVKDCGAAICCLGHNISVKGIYGRPHRLVSNTVIKTIEAIKSVGVNPKFVLMSTTAYTNKKIGEKNSLGEKIIFGLLEIILPPHKDNMRAADYLIYKAGSITGIEWVAVRPDSLYDEEKESPFETHEKKLRSPIFNAGKTSRINVSHFMAELVTDNNLWQEWKYKTPVLYNKE